MTRPFALTPGFVPDPDALFAVVRDEVPWTEQMRSRSTASMGIPYNYAGASYPEAPWHPAVAALRDRVAAALGFVVTNCLLNRYPTGEHTIGWHTDDTSILAPGTPIAIVSLGAERTLQLRSGSGADDDPFHYDHVRLAVGSLFVMSQQLQHTHKHGIKREPGAAERISLTFRHLTHAPPPVDRPPWGHRG
jgi:alkylated DNA repair dioxygenase AlkB